MADIKRNLSELLTLYADNTSGGISPQDLRDGIKSLYGNYYVNVSTTSVTLDADNVYVQMKPSVSALGVNLPNVSADDGSGDTYSQSLFVINNVGTDDVNIIPNGSDLFVGSNSSYLLNPNETIAFVGINSSEGWGLVSKYTSAVGSGAVDSVNSRTGVVVLSASDVGLENVNNTTDLNKPISTATQTELDNKLNNVVAGSNIDIDYSDPLSPIINAVASSAISTVDSVNSRTGVVVLSASDVNLGNVDNTTDLNKPISTATGIALSAISADVTTISGDLDSNSSGVSAIESTLDQLDNIYLNAGAWSPLTSNSSIFESKEVGVSGDVSVYDVLNFPSSGDDYYFLKTQPPKDWNQQINVRFSFFVEGSITPTENVGFEIAGRSLTPNSLMTSLTWDVISTSADVLSAVNNWLRTDDVLLNVSATTWTPDESTLDLRISRDNSVGSNYSTSAFLTGVEIEYLRG